MVAPIIFGSEGNKQPGTAKAALDIWCYMQDEEGPLYGAVTRKEFLCLGGNLWLIPSELAEANTASSAVSGSSTTQAHQAPISFAAIKHGLRFDAFSKKLALQFFFGLPSSGKIQAIRHMPYFLVRY
jgi:hypothetical protein